MRRCLIVCAVGCNFSAGHVHDAPAGEPAPGIDTNIVFVTSNTVVVGMIGGLDAADEFCQTSAQAVGLPGRYVAWLSTTTTNAATRLANARGWVRVDGKPVVDAVDDLVAGHILYPPLLDEHGQAGGAASALDMATATAGNGMRLGETCNDYTSQGGAITVGRADGTTERWTNANAGVGCTSPVHLYCFGIDHANQVMVTPAPGRRAFLSKQALMLAGLDTADQQCTSEAMAAGLPGTFVAGLSTTTQSAIMHAGLGPWVRVDGVAFGDLDAPSAPLNVTVDGAYVSAQVWTGASAPNQPGTSASTCADWAASSGSGLIGDAARSNGFAFSAGAVPCTTALSVYCLQR